MTNRIVMKAEYALLAQPFISNEETRYYLNGFHVEADPANGIRIVATDGRALAVFHDSCGLIEGATQIVRLPKTALAMIKKPFKGNFEWVLVIEDGSVALHQGFMPKDGSAWELSGKPEASFQDATVKDATYPAYQRVVPQMPATVQATVLTASASVLKRFEGCAMKTSKGETPVTFVSGANESDPIIVLSNRSDFLGVLMPHGRPNKEEGRPSFPSFWTTWPAPAVTSDAMVA